MRDCCAEMLQCLAECVLKGLECPACSDHQENHADLVLQCHVQTISTDLAEHAGPSLHRGLDIKMSALSWHLMATPTTGFTTASVCHHTLSSALPVKMYH